MNSLEDLKTPCLVLDVDRVRANAARMTAIANRLGVRLRPHIKTHKCVEVAHIQTAGHSGALTASTLAEIRAFSEHGYGDFTYAVPIEPGKFAEAVEIVQSGLKLNVITADECIPALLDARARAAGVRIGVFMKVDCGYHRCGVAPDSSAAFLIPKAIDSASNLDFAGILTHAGHSYHASSIAEIRRIAGEERDVMRSLADRLRAAGIAVPTVSIGSTPTISHADDLDGIDEVRPGNYIFFDAFQATLGSCGFEDCALTVLTAVTGRDRRNRKIVVDAGAIALSKDRGPVDLDANCGYGRVLEAGGRDLGLRVDSLSQEHGEISVGSDDLLEKLSVGTRLRILSNHSCLATAQHDHFNAFENGNFVGRWKIHRGW